MRGFAIDRGWSSSVCHEHRIGIYQIHRISRATNHLTLKSRELSSQLRRRRQLEAFACLHKICFHLLASSDWKNMSERNVCLPQDRAEVFVKKISQFLIARVYAPSSFCYHYSNSISFVSFKWQAKALIKMRN